MMSDLVIVKVKDGINIKADMMEYWRKEILRQKETGVIVLPWFLTAVAVPEDTEIQFEEREAERSDKVMTSNNLCSSCTNIGCEFQSGIVRTTCAFYMPPLNPFQNDGLSSEDRAMLDGMRDTAYVCGYRGGDVEFAVHQALKKMGRYDLLPPCEQGNSEINNKVKDLSKRVEDIENQIKEDKEEQLKKLKAELDYAKFCCDLKSR